MTWYEKIEQDNINLFHTTNYEGKAVAVRGIECGEGWKDNIREFLDSLEWYRVHNLDKDQKEPIIKIFLIKEI